MTAIDPKLPLALAEQFRPSGTNHILEGHYEYSFSSPGKVAVGDKRNRLQTKFKPIRANST